MIDVAKPIAYFNSDDDLVSLQVAKDGEMYERMGGQWTPVDTSDLDVFSGNLVVPVTDEAVAVVDQADGERRQVTLADLEQYKVPMNLGNE